ncbi:phenylalanine--tRNA ligase subunit beta [Cyanobacterium sp. uoEpiScrs1]|uniref:phenylalanine--tRNA ligase subunit beta n=1 Tax=Cyanobacterium sp. uoEpiScrs1 TaxID=2976343 RepID=UPI00226AA32D|nr:phenylalanine--tRNA ligase subunit beta [Cyanobacterium sp. uoEpiScrs1]
MRISVNWLRELINFTLPSEALADILTTAGLEVDQIEDRRQWADGVVIGKIIDCQPHPNANKLSVCQVDIGKESYLNIVCGAPNVVANSIVAVATIGTYLPKINLKIKPAKLRGIKSEGMICSLSEVGLSEESTGIYIFEGYSSKLGVDARPLLGLDDIILDISPTANRADALSMVGIAREVAALTGGELNLPESPIIPFPKQSSYSLKVNASDGNVCSAYIGTVIENVKIAQSPKWLQNRLEAAEIRPINNVVDVTNLILLEWGQPLHAFDRDKLETVAKKIPLTLGVRLATEQETLKTLDQQERNLKSANLVVTANNQPVALAGVMGGYETGVDNTTQNIVLEAALFDRVMIRRSSRSQNLRSESSARYERGINQSELETACNLAITLIIKLTGGNPVTQVMEDNRLDLSTESIILRLERIHQILGPIKKDDTSTDIAAKDVERILINLGCDLVPVENKNNVWKVSVPSYRYQDLKREIDLIEEVARLYGYEHFCEELPDKTEPGGLSFNYQIQRKIREMFRATGLTEIVQYSLVKPEKADIIIANPLFAEYAALRTNLLDGLIDAFTYNQSQRNGALNAFEIGRIFRTVNGEYREFDEVAGIMGGDMFPQGGWLQGGKSVPMKWYEAKGILENVFIRLGLDITYLAYNGDKRLHPGRTASLWIGKEQLGIFGQLHPQLRQEKDLIDTVYAFTLNFNVLLEKLKQKELINPIFTPYSTYPAVERDLAFFAPLKVSVSDLIKVMNRTGGDLLTGVELFDQYQGENVPKGKRSLAFSLAYRANNRTLTDGDVEPIHDKIRNALVKRFEVILRS